jgi:hypothetical protein
VNRLSALPFALLIACCSPEAKPPVARVDGEVVAQALQKCTEASTKPSVFSGNAIPVEIFDECIVDEANRSTLDMRQKICAFGKSGGIDRSPVEVYMSGDKCITDYE